MNQNLITLSSKKALELFDESLSNIINTENDYLSLDGLELTIGYNFDAFYMVGDICNSEEEAGVILESLSDLMKSLKPYYSKPFEIAIFAYHGAYSIDYWKFDGEKLFGGGDEIAFLYSKNEDDFPDDEYDEYEDAVSDYVDKITEEVRDSSTISEDLIKAINDNGLYEIK